MAFTNCIVNCKEGKLGNLIRGNLLTGPIVGQWLREEVKDANN